MTRLHLGSIAAGAMALLISVAGCGGGGDDDATNSAERGTLVIALPTQPENLNPIYGDNVYEGNQKFFNGLLRYAKDLSPEPDVASALPTRSTNGQDGDGQAA